jgi:hypothetical protein
MAARERANMGFLSAAVHRSNEKPEDFSAVADSAFSHGLEDNPHVKHDTTSLEVASSISKVFSSGYKGTNSESCKEQVTPDIACVHTSSSFCSKIACDIVTPSALSDTHVSSYVSVAQANTGIGTGVFLGGRCSVDKVVAFGGVSPPLMGSRSSKRIMHQSDADATQMERAQMRFLSKG